MLYYHKKRMISCDNNEFDVVIIFYAAYDDLTIFRVCFLFITFVTSIFIAAQQGTVFFRQIFLQWNI